MDGDSEYRGAARGSKSPVSASPSTAIVKFWQGIVEICLRGAVILVAFPALVSAGTASSHVSFGNTTGLIPADIESARVTSKNLAGWVIFTAIMSMVYEGVVIALRFVNVDKVNDYIGVFFIADIVCSALFAVTYFAMVVGHGLFSSVNWKQLQSDHETQLNNEINFSVIRSSMGATAAFSFFSMVLFIGLCVWMAVFLFAKWQQYVTNTLRGGHDTLDTDAFTDDE